MTTLVGKHNSVILSFGERKSVFQSGVNRRDWTEWKCKTVTVGDGINWNVDQPPPSSPLLLVSSPSSNCNWSLPQVSWIRHSDLHILTVGRYTYTADNRYQSIYNPTTDEWILQVDIIVISQPAKLFLVWEIISKYSPESTFSLLVFPRHKVLVFVYLAIRKSINVFC